MPLPRPTRLLPLLLALAACTQAPQAQVANPRAQRDPAPMPPGPIGDQPPCGDPLPQGWTKPVIRNAHLAIAAVGTSTVFRTGACLRVPTPTDWAYLVQATSVFVFDKRGNLLQASGVTSSPLPVNTPIPGDPSTTFQDTGSPPFAVAVDLTVPYTIDHDSVAHQLLFQVSATRCTSATACTSETVTGWWLAEACVTDDKQPPGQVSGPCPDAQPPVPARRKPLRR